MAQVLASIHARTSRYAQPARNTQLCPTSPEREKTDETCETCETRETMKPTAQMDTETPKKGFKVSSGLKSDETYFGIDNTGVTVKGFKVSEVSRGFSDAVP
jgi:hypothetical protein